MPDLFATTELPGLDGEIRTAEPDLAAAAQDWGRLVQARPQAVVRPATPADVAAVVRFAADRGIPVAARGSGHSPFGQSQAEGGIVLDMTSLARVYPGAGDEVVVDAGARWHRVLRATLPRGLTPPVLTDYLELTVGGTLAVGGIGGASHEHGAQTDTVTALDVVTGTGELVRCSAEREPELFDAVRAGLGQCGVITRATIRLRPARQRTRRWKLSYATLAGFLADQRRVVGDGRFDYVEGQLLPGEPTGTWRYVLDAASFYSLPDAPDEQALLGDLSFDPDTAEAEDTTYHEFLDRMADGEAELRAEGSWFHPHPWVTVFLPDGEVETVVAEALAATTPDDLGASGLVLLYPVRRDRLATPLLRVPSTELVWLFALLRTARPYDPAGPARMVAGNTELAESVRALGGTVYPAGMLPMSPPQWEDHFGEAWKTFESARQRHDPRGVLAPGQGVFGSR
ncbi:FAD-binding protein [Prauserella oleivorans]|uniref:FAD-binding protein n=1 Tax=Prauserella oleivorans TaxID=1478153 RepID=A0ABW5W8S1_9PSEU